LGKGQRLKSRKLIGRLFSEGNHISSHPLRVLYLAVEQPARLQAGFTVSSRTFRKAVDRNRIKRLMREAYRLNKGELETQLETIGQQLVVFFIYTGKEIENYAKVEAKMKSVLSLLLKKLSAGKKQ